MMSPLPGHPSYMLELQCPLYGDIRVQRVKDVLDSTDISPISLDRVKESSSDQALRVENPRGNHRENFPTVNRNCFKCGGVGHFARVCPSGRYVNEQRGNFVSSNSGPHNQLSSNNGARNLRSSSNAQPSGPSSTNNYARNFQRSTGGAQRNARPPANNNQRAFVSQDENIENESGHAYSTTNVDHNASLSDWFIDSASSKHYCNDENQLYNRRECFSSVLTANGDRCQASSVGDLDLKTSDGSLMKLKNVESVSTFDKNLLSVPATCDRGNIVVFTDKECIFLDKNKCNLNYDKSAVKMIVPRTGNAYIIKANKINSENYANSCNDDSKVISWHRKFIYTKLSAKIY